MSIKEICNRELVSVGRDDTVFKAAQLMRKNHVGNVLVVEEKQHITVPIGIVTDRDVVIEVVAPGLDPHVITVGDIMQAGIITIDENAGVFDAIRLMTSQGVRRLPVVKKDGRLTGIITLDDLFINLAGVFCNFTKLLSKELHNELENRR